MSSGRKLVVSVDDQTLTLFEGGGRVREFPVSTAARGVGCREGSLRTPVGNFSICQKIGDGAEPGTIFVGREPAGVWDGGHEGEDLILGRILRLEGLDEENANTFDRYVYIHGTNEEGKIGVPASHGCVRLRIADMIELYDLVSEGDALEILAPRRPSGPMSFVLCEEVPGAAGQEELMVMLEEIRSMGWRPVLLAGGSPADWLVDLSKIEDVEFVSQMGGYGGAMIEWYQALLPEKVALLRGRSGGGKEGGEESGVLEFQGFSCHEPGTDWEGLRLGGPLDKARPGGVRKILGKI